MAPAGAQLFDQLLELLEGRRSGALQPFEQHHFTVDNIGARLEQPRQRELRLPLEREPVASATTKASKP